MASTVTVRISDDLLARCQAAADAEGMSLSAWVRRAIEQALDGPSAVELASRVEELERLVGRLSEMAGF